MSEQPTEQNAGTGDVHAETVHIDASTAAPEAPAETDAPVTDESDAQTK